MKKTNAIRILEGCGVDFEVYEYEDDAEKKLELGAAARTAAKVGADPLQVFKTIVMRSDAKEILVFCQNATCEINPKKARNAASVKEISSVKPEELLGLTGYVRGGCSPIGMKKKYRTFIDESALLSEKIYVSAGVRGMQIAINPEDLIKLTDATVCDLEL